MKSGRLIAAKARVGMFQEVHGKVVKVTSKWRVNGGVVEAQWWLMSSSDLIRV
jgi:hypothetical protein